MKNIIAGILLITYSSTCLAHGGGLDQSGCHHDTSNGTYHCHNGSSSSSSESSSSDAAVNILAAIAAILLVKWIFDKSKSADTLDEIKQDPNFSIRPESSDSEIGISVNQKF